MGLIQALNNAVSGLGVNQQNLNVLSHNISNANTANYSNQVVNQQAQYLDGQDTGAAVSSITRQVNAYLVQQMQAQTTVNTGNTTLTSYYGQIQNLLGQPGNNNSIDNAVASFFSAMKTMANSPSSTAATNVVDAAQAASNQISGLASGLQNLRLQAESDINSSISNINSDLQNLYQNNAAIEHAQVTGQNTNGLMDQRDALITDLAGYMNITANIQADGTMDISTAGGITLLTNTTYASLSHTALTSTAQFTNNTNISPINVTTLDQNGNSLGTPVAIATGGPSTSVTTSLTSGKLQTLMQMRDSIVPNILNQLDQLAGSMTNAFNAINNSGTGFPPPNSYTGTTLISGNSVSSYSGNLQLAVLNSNGTPVTSPYGDEPNGLQPMTLNLASLNSGQGTGTNSVDSIINYINQYFGPPQNKVELGSLNNVQLSLASNNVPTGNTLSFNFNLNNISAKNANFYSGGYTVLDDQGNVVSSTALSTVSTAQPSLAITSYGITQGSDNIKLTTSSANTLQNGDVIYLNPPSGPVDGVSASKLGGFFTISGVSGNSFTITAPGAGAQAIATNTFAASVTANTKYATDNAGTTVNTGANGNITATITYNGADLNPTYFTVQANVATLDANGNLVQSTVSYRVPNNQSNAMNSMIGAQNATGNGKLVSPQNTGNQSYLTAQLVDANGNLLPKTNGTYGNAQGYLKIVASNGNSVAINEMDSNQLGYSGVNGTTATNQGFSQYFGLNNFFTPLATPGNYTNAAINMGVESNLVNNPSLLSTGKLTLGNQPSSNAGMPPNYTYIVSAGDNSVSQQLAKLGSNQATFSAIGGLAGGNTTFANYAGQIVAATSTNSTTATNAKNNSEALLNGLTKSAQQVSGVNLDQELANTVVYQNAYSASARVISVVSTMFSELINSIGQ